MLVGGWGINDADYNVVTLDSEGKQLMCPIYATWKSMIKRAKSEPFKLKYPTYREATITENWKRFSKFKAWTDLQNYMGLDLDKDILSPENKHYSEETCVYIPHSLNTLLRFRDKPCQYPLGVVYNKPTKKMTGTLTKPYIGKVCSFDGRNVHLGMFATMQEAHKAWQIEKSNQIEYAIAWYATQGCFRTDVAEALTKRVWKLRLQAVENKETKYL